MTQIEPSHSTDRSASRKRWTNAIGLTVLAATSIWLVLNGGLNTSLWQYWIVVGAAVLSPIWAVASLLGAWKHWDEQKINSLARRSLLWIVGVPIVLGLGFYVLSATSDWFKTIPSWAAVIIVLLFLILMQKR